MATRSTSHGMSMHGVVHDGGVSMQHAQGEKVQQDGMLRIPRDNGGNLGDSFVKNDKVNATNEEESLHGDWLTHAEEISLENLEIGDETKE
ncbi:hypothetical protein RIF29_03768 [Crotalaria pallida]|uniref:Uncharacterized protein n=1 Tax=Crotalaria pallida TaxID=3830 RepID=A0AAN9J0G4_CROPI